jgi:PHD finger-like domain-containing protein 5A
VCDAPGTSDAYYCRECVALEKDRDGCPKVVNVGQGRTDAYYERRKFKAVVK